MTEQNYIDLLLRIYPCEQLFTLKLTNRYCKTVLETYNIKNRHIRIHNKDSTVLDCCYTAIHEYAHHLMYTKFNGHEYRPHGKEFHFVYNVLISMAIQKRLLPENLTDRSRHGGAGLTDEVISRMLKC